MAQVLNPTVLRHRDRLRSMKYSTIEACFSVPMLNLTMPNLPFVIAFVLVALGWSPAWVGLLAALPQMSRETRAIWSTTAGAGGVVALWSR